MIIDSSDKNLERCKSKILALTNFEVSTVQLDIMDEELLISELINIDIFLSSVPYSFNLYLTDIAIKSKTSMVDLGGHR